MVRASITTGACQRGYSSVLSDNQSEVCRQGGVGVISINNWFPGWTVSCHILVKESENSLCGGFIVCKDARGS